MRGEQSLAFVRDYVLEEHELWNLYTSASWRWRHKKRRIWTIRTLSDCWTTAENPNILLRIWCSFVHVCGLCSSLFMQESASAKTRYTFLAHIYSLSTALVRGSSLCIWNFHQIPTLLCCTMYMNLANISFANACKLDSLFNISDSSDFWLHLVRILGWENRGWGNDKLEGADIKCVACTCIFFSRVGKCVWSN